MDISMWRISCVLSVFLVQICLLVHSQENCNHVNRRDDYHVMLLDGVCYHLADGTLTWTDATQACRRNNGTLATIPSSSVNEDLIQRAVNLDFNDRTNVSFYWIGARVTREGANVTWQNNRFTTFSGFPETEPSGFGNRGCVLLDPTTKEWATDFCDQELELTGYICEYETSSESGAVSHLRTEKYYVCSISSNGSWVPGILRILMSSLLTLFFYYIL